MVSWYPGILRPVDRENVPPVCRGGSADDHKEAGFRNSIVEEGKAKGGKCRTDERRGKEKDKAPWTTKQVDCLSLIHGANEAVGLSSLGFGVVNSHSHHP